MKNLKRNVPFVIALISLGGCDNIHTNSDIANNILNGLRPAVYHDDHRPTYNIQDRMEYWNVPAVSFVVINDMKIVYAGAFGVKRMDRSSYIDDNTLFQAASLSKPVSAAGAMTLAYKNELDIDADINQLSDNWQLPHEDYEERVTIRRILSHSAGLSVGGFTGYASEDTLPTLLEMIEGRAPANSPAVRIIAQPDTRFIYSGGGYLVMQKMMEDITGKNFSEIMHENVFRPLNMENSCYAPLDSIQKTNAAYGHNVNDYIPNHAPIHVESAAGGLWTTPTDLGLLLIELMKAYTHRQSKILDPATVQSMMEPHYWDFGLGFKVLGEGKDFRFSHGGATRGWHSHFMAFPGRGQAVVIMTNGTNGWVLWPEIVRSAADALNWPVLKPRTVKPMDLKESQMNEYAGTYEMNGLQIQIKPGSPLFIFQGAGLKWHLVPSKTDTLEIIDMDGQIFFRRDANNAIKGLHLWFGEPDWSPYRAWDFIRKDE